jgi:hypothetical protein
MPYGRFILWLCGTCLIFPFAFAGIFLSVAFAFAPAFSWVELLLALALGSVFLICGAWFAVELFMTEVSFSKDGIFRRRRWQQQATRVSWKEIAHLHYSDANHWLIIKSRTGKKVRVSRFRQGFCEFWRTAEPQLERPVIEDFFKRLYGKQDYSGLRPNGW